jgi:hypothetical protein
VLGGLAESLQLLLAVVAIVQGIWGELREHVQQEGERHWACEGASAVGVGRAGFGHLGHG